jgi:hypothetical protein
MCVQYSIPGGPIAAVLSYTVVVCLSSKSDAKDSSFVCWEILKGATSNKHIGCQALIKYSRAEYCVGLPRLHRIEVLHCSLVIRLVEMTFSEGPR